MVARSCALLLLYSSSLLSQSKENVRRGVKMGTNCACGPLKKGTTGTHVHS
jgi:hypothetical protein